MRLGIKCIAFFESFPEDGVAHDDRVNDAEFVEGELVLTEDPHLLGASDVAHGGFLLTSENLHKSGLAGAIGAGNGIASAFHEGSGHVFEKDARAEPHSDFINCDHKI